MTTTENVTQVKLNVMTEAQYSSATKNTNELYMVTDAKLPASDISGLATVATSGSYNDLSNKPTIPTVNNATLTITQGGMIKGTFTANASSDETIDLDAGGGSSGSSRNIGEIIQSTIPLTDAGLHLLDGSVINGSGSYADFVTHIAGLVSGHSELFTTEANWQTSNDNYGACDKFVYDSVNNTVRLPKRVTDHGVLIKSYSSGTDWYRIYSDGWCEQGGYQLGTASELTTINLLLTMANTNYCIYYGETREGTQSHSGSDNYSIKLGYITTTSFGMYINANTGNGVFWQASGYTDISDLQQTPIYEYIVIANSVKTPVEVDIDEVMTDLNDKVDKSDLAPVQCVIETYSSGANWYRVWSDGWIEQGGTRIATATWETITFLKPFANNNYTSLVSNTAGGTSGNGIRNKTATTMQIYQNWQYDWYACGY